MRPLIAPLHLLRALWHAIAGWLTITLVFPRVGTAEREARVQAWAGEMLRILGIGLRVEGPVPAQGPLLLVANHISWLDILVLHAARHCRFVSKSEVARWPLIGTLATGAGTLYIERDKRRDALRTVHTMADGLRAGDIVAVFPEGTTSDGLALRPFHANLLQAALAAPAPVQPVGVTYVQRHTRQLARSVAYIDNDTLLASLWRTVASPPVTAVVRFGAPQAAEGRDRRVWAAELQDAVAALRPEVLQKT